jgi:hypothetical protein
MRFSLALDRQRDFYLRALSSLAPYADFRADARRSLLHTRQVPVGVPPSPQRLWINAGAVVTNDHAQLARQVFNFRLHPETTGSPNDTKKKPIRGDCFGKLGRCRSERSGQLGNRYSRRRANRRRHPNVAVGPQYDTTHVYVAPQDFDRFVASLVATFGGRTTKQGVFTVTPTPSSTMSQLVLTPVGSISVFGFKTPIPYLFGAERTMVTSDRVGIWMREKPPAGWNWI